MDKEAALTQRLCGAHMFDDVAKANTLMDAIKGKLVGMTDAEDAVLAEYVMVMVRNGKSQREVADRLKALLPDSVIFTSWLWESIIAIKADQQPNVLTQPDSSDRQQVADSAKLQPVQESKSEPKRSEHGSSTSRDSKAGRDGRSLAARQQIQQERQQREAQWAEWEAHNEMVRVTAAAASATAAATAAAEAAMAAAQVPQVHHAPPASSVRHQASLEDLMRSGSGAASSRGRGIQRDQGDQGDQGEGRGNATVGWGGGGARGRASGGGDGWAEPHSDVRFTITLDGKPAEQQRLRKPVPGRPLPDRSREGAEVSTLTQAAAAVLASRGRDTKLHSGGYAGSFGVWGTPSRKGSKGGKGMGRGLGGSACHWWAAGVAGKGKGGACANSWMPSARYWTGDHGSSKGCGMSGASSSGRHSYQWVRPKSTAGSTRFTPYPVKGAHGSTSAGPPARSTSAAKPTSWNVWKPPEKRA